MSSEGKGLPLNYPKRGQRGVLIISEIGERGVCRGNLWKGETRGKAF